MNSNCVLRWVLKFRSWRCGLKYEFVFPPEPDARILEACLGNVQKNNRSFTRFIRTPYNYLRKSLVYIYLCTHVYLPGNLHIHTCFLNLAHTRIDSRFVWSLQWDSFRFFFHFHHHFTTFQTIQRKEAISQSRSRSFWFQSRARPRLAAIPRGYLRTHSPSAISSTTQLLLHFFLLLHRSVLFTFLFKLL